MGDNANTEYQRVFHDLEQTRLKCENTMNHCNSTLSLIQNSIKNVSQTKHRIDLFYEDLNTAFNGLCRDVAPAPAEQAKKDFQYFKKGNNCSGYSVSHHSNIKECLDSLKNKKNIVFLTGPGLSLAHPFTHSDQTHQAAAMSDNLNALEQTRYEQITAAQLLQTNPEEFWQSYLHLVGLLNEQPLNPSYGKIQELMNSLAPAFTLITQNIDGLQRQALDKSTSPQVKNIIKKRFYELNGNKDYLRCSNEKCKAFEVPFKLPANFTDYQELICQTCHLQARPNILYSDETNNKQYLHADNLLKELKDMDALVLVGAKLDSPIAQEIVSNSIQKRIPLIEVNQTPECEIGALILNGKAEQIIGELCNGLMIHNSTRKNNHQSIDSFRISNTQIRSLSRKSIGSSKERSGSQSRQNLFKPATITRSPPQMQQQNRRIPKPPMSQQAQIHRAGAQTFSNIHK